MKIKKNDRELLMLFSTTIGSRAYGTHIDKDMIIKGVEFKASDWDNRGVCVPLDDNLYYGFHSFEQDNNKDEHGEENPIYSIKKFMKLAADNNPNILELLFINDPALNKYIHPIWKENIYPRRHMFLSKKCKHSYKGYAMAQKSRMEKHRKWLDSPPEKPKADDYFYEPSDKYEFYKGIYLDYDVNMPGMKERLHYWIDNLKEIPKSLIYTKTHGKKVVFRYKHDERESQGMLFNQKEWEEDNKEYAKYKSWRENRNEKRFRMEEVMGYDPKHSAHCVRLLDQCEEILTSGKLSVCNPKRVNRWRDIRFMKVPYEEFHEEYEEKMDKLDKLYENSRLPEKPPIKKIEQLCINITKKVLGGYKRCEADF